MLTYHMKQGKITSHINTSHIYKNMHLNKITTHSF